MARCCCQCPLCGTFDAAPLREWRQRIIAGTDIFATSTRIAASPRRGFHSLTERNYEDDRIEPAETIPSINRSSAPTVYKFFAQSVPKADANTAIGNITSRVFIQGRDHFSAPDVAESAGAWRLKNRQQRDCFWWMAHGANAHDTNVVCFVGRRIFADRLRCNIQGSIIMRTQLDGRKQL